MLEAIADIDPKLVGSDVIEELASDAESSVRSSAATILYLLSLSAQVAVPIDIVARLARPDEEDWYVYTPAISALQELSLTGQEAMERIAVIAASENAGVRAHAASALLAIAKVKPAIFEPRRSWLCGPIQTRLSNASPARSLISSPA
jgi:hypothetical protein